MAGGLAITGVAIGAGLNSGQVPKHAVLAANESPVSAVNLDNCPTLAEGYHGGCVDQLQAELNGIEGLSLSVDGTFGPRNLQRRGSVPAAEWPPARWRGGPRHIYFNRAQTDYFDSGESKACALLGTLIYIPAVGEAAEVLVAGCEVQWQIVELQARQAEDRGMCLKIKFTPPPAFVWWPDIYSGKYCD